MITLPYVKLGTIPYGSAIVKNKRKLPEVGDIIFIRENRTDKDKYNNLWIEVRVKSINTKVCYFVSKV